MLQSEFYDRTKVTLTGEEYARVEEIYNRTKVEKDEFCKLWLEIRNNKILDELLDHTLRMEELLDKKDSSISNLKKELDKERERSEQRMKDFARKVVENFGDDKAIYDAVEEEFTLDFIIKVKLQENMDLEEHERKHLIGKL